MDSFIQMLWARDAIPVTWLHHPAQRRKPNTLSSLWF